MTAGLFDEAVNRGKFEARAFLLPRKGGLEQTLTRLRIYADANASDLEDEVRIAVALEAGGADVQLAAVRHRIADVDREVEDHLHQLAALDEDGPVRPQIRLDFDPRPEASPEQRERLARNCV